MLRNVNVSPIVTEAFVLGIAIGLDPATIAQPRRARNSTTCNELKAKQRYAAHALISVPAVTIAYQYRLDAWL